MRGGLLMDEDTLRQILKEELNPIRNDIKDLKTGQEEIKNMLQDLETTNANRHMETNLKLEELKELKQVTKENCYDIAKLKAVK